MTFTLHSQESAPEASRSELSDSLATFGGWIPNLHRVMAEAPMVLTAYKQLHTCFQKSSFNNTELTVVWQTINLENECHYCLPAHSYIAHAMKVDRDLIQSLRRGETLQNPQLQVLRETTLSLLRNRGRLSEQEVQKFKESGYGNQQLLEIVLGLAQKTISNYTNHLANTPIDDVFSEYV